MAPLKNTWIVGETYTHTDQNDTALLERRLEPRQFTRSTRPHPRNRLAVRAAELVTRC
jgi:hypothetical protein